jgi:hypothetical protein
LFPFYEYVFAPGKSPVEMQPGILDMFFLGMLISSYPPRLSGFEARPSHVQSVMDSAALGQVST